MAVATVKASKANGNKIKGGKASKATPAPKASQNSTGKAGKASDNPYRVGGGYRRVEGRGGLGVLLHDFTYSIAGIAGCATVLALSLVVGQVMLWVPYLTGGGIALCVVWVGYDWYRRGNLWDALRTGPSQDLKDWQSGAKAPLSPKEEGATNVSND